MPNGGISRHGTRLIFPFDQFALCGRKISLTNQDFFHEETTSDRAYQQEKKQRYAGKQSLSCRLIHFGCLLFWVPIVRTPCLENASRVSCVRTRIEQRYGFGTRFFAGRK